MRRQIKLYAQRQLASALTHETSGELEFAHLATLKILVLALVRPLRQVHALSPPPFLPQAQDKTVQGCRQLFSLNLLGLGGLQAT